MKKIFTFVLILGFLSSVVYAGSATVTVSGAPPAAGTWTSGVNAAKQGQPQLNISISGTWSATVFLQRSFDGTTYHDVVPYTSNIQTSLIDNLSGVRYRLGVKNGGYSSGSAVLGLYW